MQLAHYMQPGLLEQIVGRRLVAHQPQQVAIQPVLIVADSLGQRSGVGAPQARGMSGWVRHGKTLVDRRLINHNRIGYTGGARKRTQAAVGTVGRTPWAAADAPVGLLAPCKMPISSFRQWDEGVQAQRAPRPGGPPHHSETLPPSYSSM